MLTMARGGMAAALLFILLAVFAGANLVSAHAGDAPPTLRRIYGLTQPERLKAPKTALVLVDFQEEFFSGDLKLPDGRAALENAAQLLSWARDSGISVAHVRNVGAPGARLFAADGRGIDLMRPVRPAAGELVVTKSMAGGFTRTDLDAQLRARGIDTLIVSGLMTHLAVDSTVRDALVLGYRVILPSDASATRDLPKTQGVGRIDHRTVHEATLAALADRFADVLPTRALLALPIDPTAG